MDKLLILITQLVRSVAESGAGFFSWGASYQPEIPEELLRSKTMEQKHSDEVNAQ